MKDLAKILAAFAGGALVGAAVALLTAPKSGAETRAQIIALAKEKGLDRDPHEWGSFVAKVETKLHDYVPEEELEAAVDETIAGKE